MKNLWILSEEKPRAKSILKIIDKFGPDNKFDFTNKGLKIVPILKDGKFTFIYRIDNVECKDVKNIFIKIVSGNSSFVDYLIFYQDEEPTDKSVPMYAIEETKTDDSESRNTGVYQRLTKFVLADFYYPDVKKIMLYSLQIKQKEIQTLTNLFGTRILKTLGVEILGKNAEKEPVKPFNSIDELIKVKNSMKSPPKGNVPIKLEQKGDRISISGRLFKSNGLSHDPNIGALTAISSCLRKLGWKKDIVITHHGLSQQHIGKRNKFIQIANEINIKLDGLTIPKTKINESYWHYETKSEKVGSIFIHIVIEEYTSGIVIYENHAGCERGYLHDKTGQPIVVKKYQDGMRDSYKAGNKSAIIYLPDLIIFDKNRDKITDIEGKKYSTRKTGIEELKNYDYIENTVIKPLFNPSGFERTVVIYGSKNNEIQEKEIGFMLNENGEIIVNPNAPEIIKEAVENLISTK